MRRPERVRSALVPPALGSHGLSDHRDGDGAVPALVRRLATWVWALPLVVGGALLLAGLRGSDLAAQQYRAWVFGAHGLLLWDFNWYGGHADLGYSALFPPVAALVGVLPLTIAASAGSTYLAGRLIGAPDTWPSVLARTWFALSTVGDVLVGRGPFACAVTFGVAALLATKTGRRAAACAAAIACSLFSPLAAAFLLVIGVMWAPSIGWRRVSWLSGAFAGLAVAALAGDGGYFPFPWTAFVGQLAIVAVGLIVTPRRYRQTRRGLLIYGAICLGLFAVPTPVGGNIARLGALVVGPVAAVVLIRARRRVALVVVAAPLLAFQALPVFSSTAWAQDDPSAHASYYTGMLAFLDGHVGPAGRVEIPFTRTHWEATFVAESVPLARGWERQVDVSHNDVLYQPLTADQYREWLDANAVDYVALPDTPLDQGGEAEAALLTHPPSWLTLAYTDAHWRIWRVDGATPLATGVAHVTARTPAKITLWSSGRGVSELRVRWSPYWHIAAGHACVAHAADDMTLLVTDKSGQVTLNTRPSVDNEAVCTQAELLAAGVRARP